MSHKRATAFVLDVGQSMSEKDARCASERLFELLIAKARQDKSKDEVSVILAGCGTTFYKGMDVDSGYEGVNQIWPVDDRNMANVSVDLLRAVSLAQWSRSRTKSDVIGACVWALYSIVEHCGKYKYEKNIRIITNTQCSVDVDLLKDISDKAAASGVAVDILGFNFNEPDDSDVCTKQQLLLASLSHQTGGTVHLGSELVALNTHAIPLHKKPSRPFGSSMLTIGDREDKTSLIQFPIVICIKSEVAKLPKLLKLSKPALELNEVTIPDWSDLNPNHFGARPRKAINELPSLSHVQIANQTGYRIAPDDDEDTGAKHLQVFEKNDSIEAYRYGKTSVPIGAWDQEIAAVPGDSETDSSGLQILAFIPTRSVGREMYMTNVRYVVPNTKYETADIRLSALVYALQSKDLVAIARYSYRSTANPSLVALFPHETKREDRGLMMVGLPTEYDVNRIQHMSLVYDEIADIAAASVKHEPSIEPPRLHQRFIPSTQQRQAMAAFVKNSMLTGDEDSGDQGPNELQVLKHESSSTWADENSNKGQELLQPTSLYHPLVQRIHAAVEEALFVRAHPAILPDLNSYSEQTCGPLPFLSVVQAERERTEMVPIVNRLKGAYPTVKAEKHPDKRAPDFLALPSGTQDNSKRTRT